MVRKLVVQPDGYMDRKVGQPKIRREIITVLMIGILGSLGLFYVGEQIINEAAAETATFNVIGVVLGPVIGALVLWIGYSVALHVIALQFNGRGPIRRVFKLSAWALIPIGIGNLIKSIALYLVYQDIDVAEILADLPRGPTDTVLAAGMEEPIYIAAVIISILLILWTGYLLIFAVQNAKNVSRDVALKVVAVPVAIHVLYVVWNLAQLLGIGG